MDSPTKIRASHFRHGNVRRGTIALSTALAFAFTVGVAHRVRADGEESINPAFETLERGATPKATYDAGRYSIVHVQETSFGTLWNTTTEWWRPVRGVYRFPSKYADFYRALGRPDLAGQAETRHATAEALFWGGFVLMLGGLLGGGYELYKEQKVGAIVGAGAFVGGFVALRIGGALSRPAIAEAVADDMAVRYNRALGQHLGLSLGGDF